jgi:hypothetical protein
MPSARLLVDDGHRLSAHVQASAARSHHFWPGI